MSGNTVVNFSRGVGVLEISACAADVNSEGAAASSSMRSEPEAVGVTTGAAAAVDRARAVATAAPTVADVAAAVTD